MNKYTNDKANKPDLKKCQDCGAFGMPNRTCKYWAYNDLTEWSCCHPKAIKKLKEVKKNEENRNL